MLANPLSPFPDVPHDPTHPLASIFVREDEARMPRAFSLPPQPTALCLRPADGAASRPGAEDLLDDARGAARELDRLVETLTGRLRERDEDAALHEDELAERNHKLRCAGERLFHMGCELAALSDRAAGLEAQLGEAERQTGSLLNTVTVLGMLYEHGLAERERRIAGLERALAEVAAERDAMARLTASRVEPDGAVTLRLVAGE